MTKFLATAALTLVSLGARPPGGVWEIESTHSSVRFSIAHFGISETEGRFRQFAGTVTPTGADFANAAVVFTLQAGSIDTDEQTRDTHLKSPDFLDAAKYPTLSFAGKLVKATGDKNAYQLVGNFTMHGVTKPLTLAARYGGTVPKDPYGLTKAGFRVNGQLNRKDYGLLWSKTLDTGGAALGDEVNLTANIELVKK